MKINELRLQNFRKFTDARFRFNTQSNVTVLIGDNATGKSAILNALAIMMGSYLLDFKVPRAVRHIRKDEIHLKQVKHDDLVTLEPQWTEGIALSCTGSLSELYPQSCADYDSMIWSRELTAATSKTTRINAKQIAQFGKSARAAVENGAEVLLPILTYYGTGRLWNAKKQTGAADSRTVGYHDCLEPSSNHKLFLQWFSRLEMAALQKRKTFGALEAVRSAVRLCIPHCQTLFFDIEQQQLMIEFEDDSLFSFDNLSDGYRNMLAIVADIAHRTARLNPHLGIDAAIKTPGIVLIDEIDLHLHPKWQRTVISSLREAFPKIQFIVSTHSPFIIQSLKSGEIIDLNANDEVSDEQTNLAEPSPIKQYSDRSIEDVVEDVMGLKMPSRSARLEQMYQVAEKYYDLLDDTSNATDEEKDQLKSQLDKLSAPFSENVAYHAFLERQRLKAGVVSCEESEES